MESLFAQRDKLKDELGLRDKIFSLALHDIRSAVNNIFGFLNILANDFSSLSDEEKKEYFEIAFLSSQKTISVINEFSEWGALLSSGKVEERFSLVNDLITSVVASVEQRIQNKNLRIVLKMEDNLSIFTDSFMLTAVIRNILMNAVKFTPQNGTIEIVSVRDKDSISIQIIDNGIGISAKNLQTIFSLYPGKSTEGTSGEKGTGLGLVLIKELIERMRGSISVQSEIGKGTTFTLTFPEPS